MVLTFITRSMLVAACFVTIGQSANAAITSVSKRQSSELAAIQSQDVNNDRTVAGQAYKAEKRSGADCPFANKSNRDNVAVAASTGASASRSSVGGNTVQ